MKLELSIEEFDLIVEVVGSHQDCGPTDEGWQSPDLKALTIKLQEIWHELHKDALGDCYKRPSKPVVIEL